MNELIAKFRRELDRIERLARAVEDNSAPWTGQWIIRDKQALATRNNWVLAYPHEGAPFAPGLLAHIVRHDPASELDLVAAHRELLDIFEKLNDNPERMFNPALHAQWHVMGTVIETIAKGYQIEGARW